MDIKLPSVYPIADPHLYKLHLACWNGEDEPLDVFVRSRDEWNGWNAWRDNKDDFSRQHIFGLINFYPQRDRWLFGGAYRVLSRKAINKAASYEIELLPESEPYIGRLKLILKRPGRAKAFNFENHYQNLIVSEVLAEPYTGEGFSGYDSIDLTFPMLENLMVRQRLDWKTALENTKGIYLITDISNGKRYIGSAYGTTGIWSRWQCYVFTGHGYNDDLTTLIGKSGLKYARDNFRFTLLEYFPMKTSDDIVINREGYWKNVLLSRRTEFGYNKN
jgi:hypothetical protein